MKRLLARAAAVVAAMAMVAGGSPALADPPAEWGTDWHDPITADPPVATPPTPACTVPLVDYEFRDFTPFTGTYTPQCAGPWHKVVLRMDVSVAGRQFDRLGSLKIGDVTVFKTSTAEPSPEGIEWSVEKDITAYAPLLRAEQPVWMLIGNVVNDTYTGILDTKVTLTFYGTDADHPAATTADDVIALAAPTQSGGALHGSVTVARNTERLLAEVHATGSGGGCEEFWYLTTPKDTQYSCGTADAGPYREVQVLIDGAVAGIAAPYPHIYTGGWSNPFLWYVLPAPRAFVIQALTYDLTPFLGALTDGKPHAITVRTLGVPDGQVGWDTPTNFLAWRDHASTQVTGALLSRTLGDLRNQITTTTNGDTRTVTVDAGHEFAATGYLQTSHGRVTTTVKRTLGNQNWHQWGKDETPDAQKATWTDESLTTRTGGGVPTVQRSAKRYTIDGVITVNDQNRLRTDLTLGDFANDVAINGADVSRTTLENTFTGDATWTLGVPRPDRHAVGQSTHHYRKTGNNTCYDHQISQTNGTITTDKHFC